MFRLITPTQYRRMPWKNGGGLTEEIATYPDNATLDGFDWRISIAEVARDGPFSLFPGIDRTIALLEGAGMRLRHKDGDIVMRTPFEPHAFDGNDAVDCALLDGPIRDFNAMTRRGRAQASVTVVRSDTTLAASDFTIAFAAIGTHECEVLSELPMRIPPRHTLIAHSSGGEPRALAFRPLDAGAIALAVSIECR